MDRNTLKTLNNKVILLCLFLYLQRHSGLYNLLVKFNMNDWIHPHLTLLYPHIIMYCIYVLTHSYIHLLHFGENKILFKSSLSVDINITNSISSYAVKTVASEYRLTKHSLSDLFK